MRNLTVSVDEEVARWARVAAAERDMSVSRFVGELLRAKMQEDEAYEVAMRRNLARRPRRLKRPGARYPSRDELHDELFDGVTVVDPFAHEPGELGLGP